MTPLPRQALTARHRRIELVRQRMGSLGVDVLLLSHGADLPWLTGYRAMPLERLTVLVLPLVGEPVLVVPGLEAPRVADGGDLFTLRPWADAQDPVDLVVDLVRSSMSGCFALSDRAWASTVLELQARLPSARWVAASTVTSPLRAIKDDAEVAALRAAGGAADRVATLLQSGGIPLLGRTEAAVSADLGSELITEGHSAVNFAIVGSGPNAASPHHEPGDRIIGRDEAVVCDFGGSLALDGDIGYCSDITRTVVTGTPSVEVRECYEVLLAAQQSAIRAARAGVTAGSVDKVARDIIEGAGYGPFFVHRTGHGIGIEEHEDPYLVVGNEEVLVPGHAFSVEPGIYLPGKFGMRLEDIVVIGSDGLPESLNTVEHALVTVDR